MKRILTAAFGAALLLATALVVRAQEPGFHRHGMGMASPDEMMARHEAFLAEALNLTTAQQAAAQKLHDDLAAKAKPLMDQQHQQWQDLHALLDGDNPDPTEVGRQMLAAHATGQQLKACTTTSRPSSAPCSPPTSSRSSTSSRRWTTSTAGSSTRSSELVSP